MKPKKRLLVSDMQYEAIGGVDNDRGILRGISVVTEGEAKGHGVWLDRDFVLETVRQGNDSKSGIKARFGHPTMSSTALGSFVGRFKGFRAEERSGSLSAVADLYLSNSAKDTPGGNLYDYVINLANEDPKAFGTSIVFEPADDFKKEDSPEKVFATMSALRAADLVDDPAANPDGLFSSWANATWAGQVSEFLDTHPHVFELLDKNPDVIEHFVEAYKQYRLRKGEPMGTEELDVALNNAADAAAGPEEEIAGSDEAPAEDPQPEAPAEDGDPNDTDEMQAVEGGDDEGAADDSEAESEEDVQPESDETLSQEAAPGKEYLEAFGDIGGRWYIEGLSFSQAQAEYIKLLKEENKSLRQSVLSQGEADGEEVLSASVENEAPKGNFVQQAEALAADEGISKSAAMSKLAKLNPELFRAYKSGMA